MKPTVAGLLTCHNRMEKTLQCLENLYAQNGLNTDYKLDVFLVDDGSTDGTSEAITRQFHLVDIIKGNGNLYWNQGMRLAWDTAAKTKDYDFYFWLNDDTILDQNALLELIKTYNHVAVLEQNDAVITAACRLAQGNDTFSYGGRIDKGPVLPNGKLQTCKYINGNAVLVPKAIYKKLGNLSNDYTHGMGDFDYGLRALKEGFGCCTTSDYIATCPPNEGTPGWCNPNVPLKKRWELLHSPHGLNIKEYIKFRKKFWGIKWISFAFKAYAKMIDPKFYKKISK
ncbi:glycosyltransferase family 2 protein [Flavobacterium degerlachei]|uniref:Glycosyltransferase, GT2 family n=1 Tax=Flavobacterium degerlachei TaxID=229203 RepID=A0A1H2VND9_9FLAO|nr:glycosyltransferase family 2 protein [Flavobacterium degerlachei]SDW69474.1 Glycosyltransferase, GT2 family [Flavobacterium degerlachei]